MWSFKSNNKSVYSIIIAMYGLGGLFLFLVRDRRGESTNVEAAYWLGLLLLVIATLVLLFFEDTTVEVDPDSQRLRFLRKGILKSRIYLINFQDIESVGIRRIGRTGSAVYQFHLIISLKNGTEEKPGRFSPNRDEMVALATTLAQTIGCGLEI